MALLKYGDFFLATLLGLGLAYLAANALGYAFASPPLPPALSGKSAALTDVKALLPEITKRNLFDIDLNVEKSGDGAVSAFSSFKLTGLILSANDNIAIIVTAAKDVYALRQGKPVDGYTLVKAAYNTATIAYQGTEHTLNLEENLSSVGGAPILPATSFTAPDAGGCGTQQITLERERLKNELRDLNSVINTLRVAPFYQNEKFLGYRVASMKDESPLKVLGLQVGDVINRINGEELTSPQILFNTLQKVDDVSAVTLDLMRGGEKKTIFVEIQ